MQVNFFFFKLSPSPTTKLSWYIWWPCFCPPHCLPPRHCGISSWVRWSSRGSLYNQPKHLSLKARQQTAFLRSMGYETEKHISCHLFIAGISTYCSCLVSVPRDVDPRSFFASGSSLTKCVGNYLIKSLKRHKRLLKSYKTMELVLIYCSSFFSINLQLLLISLPFSVFSSKFLKMKADPSGSGSTALAVPVPFKCHTLQNGLLRPASAPPSPVSSCRTGRPCRPRGRWLTSSACPAAASRGSSPLD